MRKQILVAVGASGVLVSGYIHFYLYFEGGYRGIAPESFAGLTISRSFAINAIAGLVLAELLVASLIWPRLRWPAVLGGMGFLAATLVAYTLTRTSGLLGSSTITRSPRPSSRWPPRSWRSPRSAPRSSTVGNCTAPERFWGPETVGRPHPASID